MLPDQQFHLVRCNREFVITLIVITWFDYIWYRMRPVQNYCPLLIVILIIHLPIDLSNSALYLHMSAVIFIKHATLKTPSGDNHT
jgi:hypothetical protein